MFAFFTTFLITMIACGAIVWIANYYDGDK